MTRKSNQVCTFMLDGMLFGVDVQQVQEVLRYQEMTRVPLVSSVVRGLINLRGQIVTALDMRRRLELRERPAGQTPLNVVVRTAEGPISLLVDDIGDVMTVDPETLEPLPPTVSGATRELTQGVHQLKDRLLLILDVEKTVNLFEDCLHESR